MTLYSELLTQRQEAAIESEKALICHFGKEAENCDNWQRLFELGWLDELTNASGRGKLPRNEDNCILGCYFDEEEKVFAHRPSLYSEKFLYCFITDIADGGPALSQYLSEIVEEADEVDCDQLSRVIDISITYLNSLTLRALTGSGVMIPYKSTAQSAESFMLTWDEEKVGSAVWICRFGIAVPGHPVIPFEVATRALKVIERQIEARRRSLTTELQPLTIEQEYAPSVRDLARLEMPADDTAENQVSKLFRKLTPANCHALAIKVGFISQSHKLIGKAKPSKIWGMVETLVWHQLADKGQTGELVQRITQYYKIESIKANYTPDGPNETRRKARWAVNEWLFEMQIITESDRDTFRTQHREPRVIARQTDV